jgi:outer membrane protein OmpA-like peptidoglycan-associated protein
LRDPLAADPRRILQTTPIDPSAVVSRWESFHSSHPDFVLERARRLLQPPDYVYLRFADGILSAEGYAPQAWSAETRRLVQALPAVTEFDESALVGMEQLIPKLEEVQKRIESFAIRFDVGSAEIASEQQGVLDNLAADLNWLTSLGRFAKQTVAVMIMGHTDRTGSEGINQKLEQERAANVLAALTARGIGANNLSVASGRESDGKARDFERKVTVKVTVANDAKP